MDSTWSPPNPPGLPGVHLEYVEQGKVLHLVTKNFLHPDNVWCTEDTFDLVICCEVDPSLRPPATDHFPIATYIDLPQECTMLKTSYNFRMVDWEDFQENLAS